MLKSTFSHISNISEKDEIGLWQQGCLRWDDYIKSPDRFELAPELRKTLKAGILESKSRLDLLDNSYFNSLLGTRLAIRSFEEFKEYVCYLDIETTGLSPVKNQVTTVCLHSPQETKTYIWGENITELKKDISNYKMIVTFNGARFDLPFLQVSQGIKFDHINLDLMYPLRHLGYVGGLKSIEQQLGIDRDSKGFTGKDAIKLWKSYKTGKDVTVADQLIKSSKALDTLVKYNMEDTLNLEKLTILTYKMMDKKMVELQKQ